MERQRVRAKKTVSPVAPRPGSRESLGERETWIARALRKVVGGSLERLWTPRRAVMTGWG